MTSLRPRRHARMSALLAALTAAVVLTAGLATVALPAAAASPTSVVPSADSYVVSTAATANYGTSTQFRIDGSPVVRSYLRFDLGSLSGGVSAATLQIHANSSSSSGFDVAGTDGSNWTETGITYANAPAVGATVGVVGPFAAGTTTSVDVTSAVQTGTFVDFVVIEQGPTAVSLASRESTNPPVLLVTLSAPPPTGSATATPSADSYVVSTAATANYGTSTQFRIDGSPVVRSYLRFDLGSLSGGVSAATLQIHANSSSSSGFDVAGTDGSNWTETGITYANAPAVGATVGVVGPFAAGTTTSVDVTSAVQTGTFVDFVVIEQGPTAVSLASRESTNPPVLTLTFGGPTPNPTPTATATASATPTATPNPTPTATATASATPTATPTATPKPTATPTATPTQTSGSGDPVLVGAGDICITSSISNANATAALITARPNAVVFTAGDNSNETGTTANYTNCVDKSWGAFKSRIHPVPGNHDYMTSGAGPYYSYFGSAAGTAGKGYYSYNLANNWHVVALNALCSEVGGCGTGSPEEVWLKADLAANPGKHIIAIWHIPSFSSGSAHGNNTSYRAWWDDLYAAHADIVINGHDHDYERFALQSPSGAADPNGIREFVSGTGGAGQRPFGTIRANSEVRSTGTFGVLQLTLHANSYSWAFVPVAGKTFTDSGTQATHS